MQVDVTKQLYGNAVQMPHSSFTLKAVLPVPWSQRFFLIFLCERDEKQAAKRRQRVAKATRRERKTSGYLGLESHFHADDSCQTRLASTKRVKLLIKRVTNGHSANTCLSAAIFLSGGRPGGNYVMNKPSPLGW